MFAKMGRNVYNFHRRPAALCLFRGTGPLLFLLLLLSSGQCESNKRGCCCCSLSRSRFENQTCLKTNNKPAAFRGEEREKDGDDGHR